MEFDQITASSPSLNRVLRMLKSCGKKNLQLPYPPSNGANKLDITEINHEQKEGTVCAVGKSLQKWNEKQVCKM